MITTANSATNNFDSLRPYETKIKVIGLGGGGCNAIHRMMQFTIPGVELIAANTDAQALAGIHAHQTLLLGSQATRGMGAGGNPEVGRAAAEESRPALQQALQGADMVFLTCGMGGGTGTGSIAVAAEVARATGALTVAVVTTPFDFEGVKRAANARNGINALRQHCHTLITVPNQRVVEIVPPKTPITVSFRLADEILRQAIHGVAELVSAPAMMNVDFADIQHIFSFAGDAVLAVGQGKGENKCQLALNTAMKNRLLDLTEIDRASGLLIFFTGGTDMGIFEIQEAAEEIRRKAHPEADIKVGALVNERFNGKVQIMIIATGLQERTQRSLPSRQPVVSENYFGGSTPSQPTPNVREINPLRELEWVVAQDTHGQAAIKLSAAEQLEIPAYQRKGIQLTSQVR